MRKRIVLALVVGLLMPAAALGGTWYDGHGSPDVNCGLTCGG
jgi:hypothetical protein